MHEEIFTTYSLGLGYLSECLMLPGKRGVDLVVKNGEFLGHSRICLTGNKKCLCDTSTFPYKLLLDDYNTARPGVQFIKAIKH